MVNSGGKIGKVFLVGAGPGDPGLITVKGMRLLERAEVVVYDYLANAKLLEYAPQAQKIYVGKQAAAHTMTQEQINALLVEKGKAGLMVVRLKGGDPFVFGRGGEECEALAAANIKFEVVPGITAAIGGPTYAGIPVTHRDFNTSFTFITGHEKEEGQGASDERQEGDAERIDWSVIAKLPCMAFYMGVKALPRICSKLIEHGMDPSMPAACIRWGTRPQQRVMTGTVENLPQKVADAKLLPPALTIVGKVVSLRETMSWFENRPLFGQTIVVTRTRQQASALSEKLSDLGANVIEAPTIELSSPADWRNVDANLRSASKYDWVVFTSQNGVKFTKERLMALGMDSRAFGKAKIAAIGRATADAVQNELSLKVDLCPNQFVAEALADELSSRKEVKGKKFLLLRADIARAVLKERLAEQGASEVADVAVYETRIASELPAGLMSMIEAGEVTWITFTSSSTAKNFMSLVGPDYAKKLTGVKLASIGPITTATLREFGLKPTVEGKVFDVDGLIEAIAEQEARTVTATNVTAGQAIQIGLDHHRSGRLLEAETIYRQVLAQDARNVDALHLLGLIAHHAGKQDDAAQLIAAAIAINPTNPDFHNNLGEVRRAQNRLDEAEQCFQRSLARNGNAALIHNNIGLVRQMQGRWEEALECHKKAAAIQPGLAGTYMYAAQALRNLKRIDEAYAALNQSRQLEPNNPSTLFLMGTLALENNRPDMAVEPLLESLRLRPTDAAAACNLGHALLTLGRYDEAIDIGRQLVAGTPQWVSAHHLLAIAHAEKGEDEKAYHAGLQALALDRNNPDLLMMMSSIAHQVGKEEESLGYSKHLIELRPNVGAAHWNRAIVLLGLGQFEEGWREFEWRLKSEPQTHLRRPDLTAPLWPEGADVAGKTVLLYCEGGFGDALQFIRYLPMVREKGAEILLECQKELRDLFAQLEGVKGLYVRGETLPSYDYQCPLQGLPFRLGTTIATIPVSIPYLAADSELVDQWKERLASLPADDLKVGVVWAGSPNPKDRRTRSLLALEALGKVDGVQFISLQRGKEAEETKNPPAGMKLTEYTEQLTDFSQAAALTQNLDLLITVDTAAAHLAGAMGKDVWVMLPTCPDFRWMLEREDTPWYPTMRLFRLKAEESWADVMERIAESLREWVSARGANR